ncbi:MAG: hypothetical protein RBS08_03830 [Bdellovibrionales bacterium]|jgi:hypothetical protein|nr:hypothetical protein [Bdellovibrionales bacterium]
MTNETQNGCCGGNKAAEAKTGACCDTKGSCGCGNKNCGCGKAKCCGKILCRLIALALFAAVSFFAWTAYSKNVAVCVALAKAEKTPAIVAPEADLQQQVDELQDKIVEIAREEKSIEGQFIEHLQGVVLSAHQAGGCP